MLQTPSNKYSFLELEDIACQSTVTTEDSASIHAYFIIGILGNKAFWVDIKKFALGYVNFWHLLYISIELYTSTIHVRVM